jgi:hypothetical protein
MGRAPQVTNVAAGMKHVSMKKRKDDVPQSPPQKADAAFDIWLQRGLHKIFDDIAREPIPDELLRLIEQDRRK